MITLVLGGARSGKSTVAEQLAARMAPPVTYVATLDVGDDADLAARVEVHRRRRPPEWRTEQAGPEYAGAGHAGCGHAGCGHAGDPPAAVRTRGGDGHRPAPLTEVLRRLEGSVLVDSLGPWLGASPGFAVDADELCAALAGRHGDTVVVSEEVGLSVHPSTEQGRRFRDALGALNQAVASCADDVLLVVAGRVLPLAAPPLGDPGPR